MKIQKQKIYSDMVIGITLFISVFLVLISSFFDSTKSQAYLVESFEIANITTEQIEVFWKGFSKDSAFRVMYKKYESSSPYIDIYPKNIYQDYSFTKGYMYNVRLEGLAPRQRYIVELWHADEKLMESIVSTKSVSEEINVPSPISGNSFVYDWIKISNSEETYIVRTDYRGSWVFDKNLVGDNYITEIYASSMLKENNPISSYLIGQVYAAEQANCDEITYSGVASTVKEKASTFQNLLTLNGGDGGNPQYLRCYQDAYCEAEKVGVNPRWTLANWVHESNASDYEYPGGSLNADFGVVCCGVPLKDFQSQLGFFLSLSHDPCNCSTCSKEQYYCCWANNYLYGTLEKVCSNDTSAYLNGLMAYYYWVTTLSDPGDFEGRLAGLPARIKTSGKSASCGDNDPIDIYKNGWNDDPPAGDEEGICCALKLEGNDKFRGDYENETTKSCSQIWAVGRNIYDSYLEYSVELPQHLNRATCEQWWDGVCCNDTGEYEWIPEYICNNKATQFSNYEACIDAQDEPPVEEIVYCDKCSSNFLYTHAYDFQAGPDGRCDPPYDGDNITWNNEKYYVCDCCVTSSATTDIDPDAPLYTSPTKANIISYQDCIEQCEEEEITCGNRTVDSDEDCDPPGTPCITSNTEIGYCSDECSCEDLPVKCNDGKVQDGEECDPPGSACNTESDEVGECSDGCTCEPLDQEPECGDNNIDDNEQCDPPGSDCISDNEIGKCSENCSCEILEDQNSLCCAVKVEGKDDFIGYFEDNSELTCDQIHIDGDNLNGDIVEYAIGLEGEYDAVSCEIVREGVCCDIGDEYEWMPYSECLNIVGVYNTYNSCMNAGEPIEDITISLKRGYNFVSWFAYDAENPVRASEILGETSVILIGAFKNGIWNQLMYKEGNEIKGVDFELLPNYAYLITTNSDLDFKYSGRRSNEFSWDKLNGWQLVSSTIFTPYSDTKSLIQSYNSVKINQVALWDNSKSSFNYFLYNDSGEEYGLVENITEQQGVFVKID